MKYLKTSIAAMMASVMLLASCGGQGTPQQNTPEQTQDDTNEDDQDEIKEEDAAVSTGDNNIVIAVNANFITFDPHAARDSLSNSAMTLMSEGLMKYDEVESTITTNLAESYEVSDDALTYTFKLLEGVTFHDGTDFNADAVVANFDRIMNPDLALRQRNNLKDLTSWTAIDEHTVEFVLEQPYMPFLDKLTAIRFISPKSIEELGEEGLPKKIVGTGPYKLVEWIDGDYCTMERNDDYRSDGVQVDTLTFRFVPENSTRVAMLEAGQADFVYPLPIESVSLIENNPDIDIIIQPSTICRYVSMNQMNTPLDNVLVRRALNHAIDKDAYIAVVRGGYGEYLTSSMSHVLPFHAEHDLYEYDVDKAKDLLAQAGYPDGFAVTLWGSNDTETVKGMNFINQQLSAIGVTVDVVPMEEATLSSSVYETTPETTEIEMWYVSWSSLDVDNATRSTFNSNYFPPTGANTNYYNNPELDRLMDEANKLTDTEEQKAKYKEIQDMIYEDAVWMFLGVDQTVYAKRANIDGMRIPSGRFDFDNASKN